VTIVIAIVIIGSAVVIDSTFLQPPSIRTCASDFGLSSYHKQ